MNVRDNQGRTPLHVAAGRYDRPPIAEPMGIYVRPGTTHPYEWLASSAKTYEVTTVPQVVKALIQLGADVNAESESGNTPLHESMIRAGSPEIAAALIDSGARVDARNVSGQTPLHKACAYSWSSEVVRTLIRAGADVNAQDVEGGTPLHMDAQRRRTPEDVRVLMEAGADISTARDNTSLDILTALSRAGSDLEANTRNGKTPLDLTGTDSPLRHSEVYQLLKNARDEESSLR